MSDLELRACIPLIAGASGVAASSDVCDCRSSQPMLMRGIRHAGVASLMACMSIPWPCHPGIGTSLDGTSAGGWAHLSTSDVK